MFILKFILLVFIEVSFDISYEGFIIFVVRCRVSLVSSGCRVWGRLGFFFK